MHTNYTSSCSRLPLGLASPLAGRGAEHLRLPRLGPAHLRLGHAHLGRHGDQEAAVAARRAARPAAVGRRGPRQLE